MIKMNKVMTLIMVVSLTLATSAMAGDKKHNCKKRDKEVAVAVRDHHKQARHRHARGHFVHKAAPLHKDVRVCSFTVSRHVAHKKNVVKRARKVHGVIDARLNPRTCVMTVRYDARRTTPKVIRRAVVK